MRILAFGMAALALSASLSAQEDPAAAPSPNEIVEAAAPEEWAEIPSSDILVMTLAPDAEGNPRQVVIQLMPAPFSQGWVHNIRLLARSGWYDNISVNRVQDNYVVQWGDPNYDNPESDGEAKPLPEGLKVMGEEEYEAAFAPSLFSSRYTSWGKRSAIVQRGPMRIGETIEAGPSFADAYVVNVGFSSGMPVGMSFPKRNPMNDSDVDVPQSVWPVHCYGMVGVGRNYSPDTGSGAELYAVIGHAPRHLDRNIALVGRVIEGMEYLSSLPRGKGVLGFYGEDELYKRTPILSVRVASDLPDLERPYFQYLSTESESFAKYAEARANRRDPFFIHPAGGADICNIPVPIRPSPNG